MAKINKIVSVSKYIIFSEKFNVSLETNNEEQASRILENLYKAEFLSDVIRNHKINVFEVNAGIDKCHCSINNITIDFDADGNINIIRLKDVVKDNGIDKVTISISDPIDINKFIRKNVIDSLREELKELEMFNAHDCHPTTYLVCNFRDIITKCIDNIKATIEDLNSLFAPLQQEN